MPKRAEPYQSPLLEERVGADFNPVPMQAPLPSLEDMRDLSVGQLAEVFNKYGIIEPWDSMKLDAMDYVKRMNVPLHRRDQALADLLGGTKRANLELARRTSERWSTMSSLQGDLTQTMVWITVGDEAMCDPCDDNGGLEMPYSEWMKRGLPGPQTCLGTCRCELMLVTD